MGFFSYDSFPLDRWVCLTCDECDRVLVPDGGMSSKPFRHCMPEDTATFFRPRDELLTLATAAGWRATTQKGTERVSWTCPGCKAG